jgi:glycosyltransferase involved in cell wall biosynthesis
VDSISVQYLPWIGADLRQCPSNLDPLRREIERCDVVHCYGLYNLICPLAAWLALRSSTPFIIEPMGMYVPRVRRVLLKRLYNGVVTRWLFRRAAAVIATSELEAEELRGSVATVAEKILVRRNGISMDFSGDPDMGARLREEWHVAPDERLIGYIGRISKKKGLLELIAAFNQAGLTAAKLLIGGPVSEPAYAERVREAVRQSPLRDNIFIEGLLEGDRYVGALKALDLFVLPSENENFGNSAAEAASAGIPVLLTRNCGIAPMIDGRVGLAVDYTIDALKDGLQTMLRPETGRQWSPFWKTVQSELSWEEPVRVMEGIYEKIVNPREKVKTETRKAERVDRGLRE